MKKTVMTVIALALVACMTVGCVGTPVVVSETTTETVAAAAATEAPVAEATTEATTEAAATETVDATSEATAQTVAVKTGYSVTTSVSDSASATADAEGQAKYEITIAAVTVDADGIIRSCKIDAVQATVKFDATGTITSDTTAAIATKAELGSNYGMVAYGGAVAEWDEQVAALCNYAEGKTVEELKNGAIDETGKAPAGSDLASSATIYLGGFVSAIEAAVNNATDMGATNWDLLYLVTENSVSSSTSATAESAGNAQLNTDIMVMTANEDGIITSCIFDAVQAKVAFDATGAVTTDLTATIGTKNEIGAGYGMVAYGGAIAEWNEQAASFAQYITGKNAEEVAGIAVSENKATDADLTSSVTIKINGFQSLVAKAFAA